MTTNYTPQVGDTVRIGNGWAAWTVTAVNGQDVQVHTDNGHAGTFGAWGTGRTVTAGRLTLISRPEIVEPTTDPSADAAEGDKVWAVTYPGDTTGSKDLFATHEEAQAHADEAQTWWGTAGIVTRITSMTPP